MGDLGHPIPFNKPKGTYFVFNDLPRVYPVAMKGGSDGKMNIGRGDLFVNWPDWRRKPMLPAGIGE